MDPLNINSINSGYLKNINIDGSIINLKNLKINGSNINRSKDPIK